jgi:hypothetical protein
MLSYYITSSVSGFIGDEAGLSEVTLKPGNHRLTVTVMDSAGESSGGHIDVTVLPAEDDGPEEPLPGGDGGEEEEETLETPGGDGDGGDATAAALAVGLGLWSVVVVLAVLLAVRMFASRRKEADDIPEETGVQLH